MNKNIYKSWKEIIEFWSTFETAEEINKLLPLQKVFDDTWIRQQSEKIELGKPTHIVYRWLSSGSYGKQRLFILGASCDILNKIPGDADRKNDALRRLRLIDKYWMSFLSAEFEIFVIVFSSFLTKIEISSQEVYAKVNDSYVELMIKATKVPIYVEAKAMQEPSESIKRREMVNTFLPLFSECRKDKIKREISLGVNFKRFLTVIELKDLVKEMYGLLDSCPIPSSHDLSNATLSVRKGGSGIEIGFPFYNNTSAVSRIRKRFNKAKKQIETNAVGLIWIKLNWEEDVHAQIEEITNSLGNEENNHIAAIILCEYEHWKCNESSIYINPYCRGDKTTVEYLCKGLKDLLIIPWQKRYQ